MISHILPIMLLKRRERETARNCMRCLTAAGPIGPREHGKAAADGGYHTRYGPLCFQLRAAARRQGTGFDSRAVPSGAGARWLRGTLLLSDARPAGFGCRRQCPADGNRCAGGALSTLFGRARAILDGALWYQRDLEARRRGPSDAHRLAERP